MLYCPYLLTASLVSKPALLTHAMPSDYCTMSGGGGTILVSVFEGSLSWAVNPWLFLPYCLAICYYEKLRNIFDAHSADEWLVATCNSQGRHHAIALAVSLRTVHLNLCSWRAGGIARICGTSCEGAFTPGMCTWQGNIRWLKLSRVPTGTSYMRCCSGLQLHHSITNSSRSSMHTCSKRCQRAGVAPSPMLAWLACACIKALLL